jgi:NADH-quinone oxidoreductase subunit N
VIFAVNSAIAAAYYLQVVREMFFRPVPDGIEPGVVKIPPALNAAIGLCALATIVLGVLPGSVAKIADLSTIFTG